MHLTRSLTATAVVTAVLGVAGCSGGEPEFTEIHVVSSDWNGWDRDHRSTETTTTLAAEDGAASSVGCGVTLTVVDVGRDVVVLRSDQALAPRSASGGIALSDPQDEVEVERDEVVEMATATTDAGCSVELVLR
ncbi:MAG TPA: hypothetical protein VGE77_03800 [Nocardioides sp.]